MQSEDAVGLRDLLSKLITDRFPDRVQTRNVALWLMRSAPADQWLFVQMCLDVRIKDGSWSEWLPAIAGYHIPFGDVIPQGSADIAGWDTTSGQRDVLAVSGIGITADEAAAYVARSAQRLRGNCDHSSDESAAAIARGTLKLLELPPP